MKKTFWILIILTFILFSITLLIKSSHNSENLTDIIYSGNREWKFSVKRTNAELIDTIILIVPEKPEHGGEKAFKWLLNTFDSTLSKMITDTMITETSVNGGEGTNIGIPSPTKRYFKFTAGIPSPEVRLPLYVGYSMKTKSTHKISDFEELQGKTTIGNIEVIGKIYYDNPIIKDNCWILDAVGESSLGTFKAKYYFHEKFGFVYFYYDFIKYQVKMEIISLKNIQ